MQLFGVTFSVGILLLIVHVNGSAVPDFVFYIPPTEIFDHAVINAYQNIDSINEIEPRAETNICGTEACAKESATMLNSLDETVQPCDNFYDFACGNFIRNTVLPEDKTIIMSFTEVQDKVEEQLRTILIDEPQENESNPLKLAKTFTRVCLNETALNEMGKIK